MKKFTLVQKLRNKIRIKGSLQLKIDKTAKIVGCTILSKGENNTLTINSNTDLRGSFLEILGDNCSITIDENCVIGG